MPTITTTRPSSLLLLALPLLASTAVAFSAAALPAARSRGTGSSGVAKQLFRGGFLSMTASTLAAPPAASAAAAADSSDAAAPGKAKKPLNVVVLGGTGYVGSRVCRKALERGHSVVSVSRRGKPGDGEDTFSDGAVKYVAGDLTDPATVNEVLKDADAVVHAVGLLFDVTTPGGGILNLIVSGSKSRPGEASTYDAITRQTAFNVVAALKKRLRLPSLPFDSSAASKAVPFAFVSAAEAGWPEVELGDKIEAIVPDALRRYLTAKRAVESELSSSAGSDPTVFRPILYRPSLIWDWTKLDVLPIIPVFNAAAALGVPFVDRTVRVETLAAAIVAGLEDGSVSGPQRIDAMESLAASLAADDE